MLMAAPAIVVALSLCGIEVWRTVQPRSPLFALPFAYSLGDAIAAGELQQAYEYIRAGQDPNDLIAVRHPGLTAGRWVLVSPLVWAVALRDPQAVQLLFAFGVRMDHPANRRAACLAEAAGNEEIVRVLTMHGGGASRGTCEGVRLGEAPLLDVSLPW